MNPSQINIGIVTHGRTRRSTRNLLTHLHKEDGQTVRVVAIENAPARSAEEALRVMELMRDGSTKAEIACHHITINPLRRLTVQQRDQAVQRILQAFGAEEHAWVLWEHDGKNRATANAADHHFHLVLSHVGPDLKALDTRRSYARLEAVARSLEIDWGVEVLTPTGRHKAVAAAARKQGREDVAQAVLATMPDNPEDLPRSTMSSRTRARAARHGIDLPRERVRIADAYRSADSGRAVRAAIEALGLSLVKGHEEDVWLVVKGGALLGALDRLARAKRQDVAARLGRIEHDDEVGSPSAADTPTEPALLWQSRLELDRKDFEARHSQRAVPCTGDPVESGTPGQGHPAEAKAVATCSPSDQAGVEQMGETGLPLSGIASDVPESRDQPVVAIASLHDQVRERVRAAQEVLRKAEEPVPAIPSPLFMAQAELQTARKARDRAERTVTQLEEELEVLRDEKRVGFWGRLRGAGRQHLAAIEEAEAALAEAQRDQAAAEQTFRNRGERVKRLSRTFEHENAQRHHEREVAVESARAALAWLSDAERVLESDPALARMDWDVLDRAVAQMRLDMVQSSPDGQSCDLGHDPPVRRF